MANGHVTIWAGDLAGRRLPMVCVRTGRLTDWMMRFKFASDAKGTGEARGVEVAQVVLGLASAGMGMAGGLVGRAIFAKRATGFLPLLRSQRLLLVLMRWWGLIGGITGLILVISAVALGSPNPWVQAVGIIGGALFVSVFPWLAVKVRVLPQGEVIVDRGSGHYLVALSRVHPNFVAAVQAMHAERAAAATQAMEAARSAVMLAPDGQHWWNGKAWIPSDQQAPPGFPLSPDGRHWYDGSNWRALKS
jgi:hypothetical protein